MVAGSVALVGFGADSLIEVAAGLVVLWLVTGERRASPRAERRAQQLIAVSFGLLAAYVMVGSLRELVGDHHPAVSRVGIGLSVVTLLAMPPLPEAKRRVGRALGSSAAVSESRQTMLCAYLSAALLIGLLANAVAGWWWADPLAGEALRAGARRTDRNPPVPRRGVGPDGRVDLRRLRRAPHSRLSQRAPRAMFDGPHNVRTSERTIMCSDESWC